MHWTHGQQVGPYTLLRPLGRGGFADVWLAERSDDDHRQQLALKLVGVGDADGQVSRSAALVREAQLCSWLDDPNVVRVDGVDERDGVVWMAMEYCDGGSLNGLVRRMMRHGLPMPPAVGLRIASAVARALDAGHRAVSPQGKARCIVHRDLKPGNVLLTTAGGVKVCDFGIAKATDETNVTGTNLLKGTASYVAPELWDDVRAFSPASDAFALGTLLVEVLLLDRLHAGGSFPQVYRRITEGDAAEDAETLAPHMPPVVPLVTQLLKRDPEARAADLGAVADELDALIATLPGPDDVGLLLRLLDVLEGRRDLGALPDAVDQSWQTVIFAATGQTLPLAPGPTGADQAWPPAFPKPLEDAAPSVLIPPPDEVGNIAEADLEPSTDVHEPPTRPFDRAAATASPADLAPTVVERSTQPFVPQLPSDDPAAPPARPSNATLRGRKSPSRKRKKGTPSWLVAVLLLVVGGLIALLAALLLEVRKPPPVVEEDLELGGEAEFADLGEPGRPVLPPDREVEPLPPPRVQVPDARPTPTKAPTLPTTKPPAGATPAEGVGEEPPPEETPEAAAPAAPCLLISSRPTGAYVWVDGAACSRRARSRAGSLDVPTGTHRIGMALVPEAAAASVSVDLAPGAPMQVHCDLLASPACRATAAPASACAP